MHHAGLPLFRWPDSGDQEDDLRAQIAMVMAVVAMPGAVAAFGTAFAEQETSRPERTLDQGHMLDLASRHRSHGLVLLFPGSGNVMRMRYGIPGATIMARSCE
jgi:hypothetical protein